MPSFLIFERTRLRILHHQLDVIDGSVEFGSFPLIQSDPELFFHAIATDQARHARAFDTYESKKHPESPRGLIFFVKFIGYILRDLA